MDIAIDSARIGRCLIKKFKPKSMDFLHWLNNFEYIADIVHIPNEKMVEFLLNELEPSALSCIQTLLAPTNPRNLSYEELIFHLEKVYGFYHGEWAANYRFIFRDQIDNENVLHYVYTLKRILSKARPFLINKLFLMIRFVNGLKDDDTKKVLRGQKNLTLNKAVAIAAQLELQKISNKTN